MEYVIEDPFSDASTPNFPQHSVGANELPEGRIVATTEPEFFSSTFEERLRSEEGFLRQPSGNLEQRRKESERLNHANDEMEGLVVEAAEYEETDVIHLRDIRNAAESEATARAAELESLSAEIKALSHVASQQIDRMDQAKARLAILEELRVHAEAKVCERAEREIRLEAEIDALRQIEATQIQRIEAAEDEVRRLAEEQARAQAAAEAKRNAEAEARQLAAAEATRLAEVETARCAEEEERKLEHLEAIRARAETAAQDRAEKEALLNSQLLAFGETAADQLKRIEIAEAELGRVNEELLNFDEKARQTTEQLAIRASELETRRNAAAEQVAQAASEVQLIAQEAEQHLAELEAIRTQAEAEAAQRAEVERQLNSDIETLRESEARQLQRIETAQGVAQRMLEKETERRRIADEEQQRLIALEARRTQAEAEAQKRAEVERQLNADIETLRESEARQLQGIETAQAVEQRMLQEETERLRIAEEGEQGLIELEAKRTQAEAEAEERAELERQLNADIELMRESAAKQLQRIEAAQDRARRMLEDETERRRIAEQEEQRLLELDAQRLQCETRAQGLREEEQRLTAEIEALRRAESEQVARIAAAEAALQALNEKQISAEVAVTQEHSESQAEPGTDTPGEMGMWPSAQQSYDPGVWSMFEPRDESNEDAVPGAEALGNGRAESTFDKTETLNYNSSSELPAQTSDSDTPDRGLQEANPAIPLVGSLAERLVSGDREDYDAVMQELSSLDAGAASSLITCLFDHPSEEVRNAAARALFDLNKDGAEFLIQALHEATPERRTQIIAALNSSGLAAEAIDSLAGESSEKTHDAFSILFAMAKAGEVQSLFQTIEKHPNIQVRLSVIKLLTFTNRPDIIPALRSLAVRGALPIEVRSALMNSIYEMSSGNRERSRSAA